MPITIAAESEGGRELADPVRDKDDVIRKLAGAPEASGVIFLKYIDPYGDTTFNRLQLPVLIQELDQISNFARDEGDRTLIAEVRQLAVFCRERPHRYLKCYGA
jgi:hypothetical protein